MFLDGPALEVPMRRTAVLDRYRPDLLIGSGAPEELSHDDFDDGAMFDFDRHRVLRSCRRLGSRRVTAIRRLGSLIGVDHSTVGQGDVIHR